MAKNSKYMAVERDTESSFVNAALDLLTHIYKINAVFVKRGECEHMIFQRVRPGLLSRHCKFGEKLDITSPFLGGLFKLLFIR